ncbi:alpha/beta fold hydrolase, partial [Hydrogenivirga sp.]
MKAHIPKAVLFLHAFPLNKDMFTHQFRALEEAGIPYIALDYPGFGDEPPFVGEVSVERLTDFVVSKINAFGMKEIVPVGDSMGGYIMFDLWRRFRELIKGFVFVATRAEADPPEGKKARYVLIGRVKEEGTDFLVDTML